MASKQHHTPTSRPGSCRESTQLQTSMPTYRGRDFGTAASSCQPSSSLNSKGAVERNHRQKVFVHLLQPDRVPCVHYLQEPCTVVPFSGRFPFVTPDSEPSGNVPNLTNLKCNMKACVRSAAQSRTPSRCFTERPRSNRSLLSRPACSPVRCIASASELPQLLDVNGALITSIYWRPVLYIPRNRGSARGCACRHPTATQASP